MIQYSRIPAIVTLLVLLGPGGYYLYSRQSDAAFAQVSQADLDKLQAAISQPNASTASWMAYAQTLQKMGSFPKAAWAYQRIIAMEPTNTEARLQAALCLARTGNQEDLAVFVKDTIGCYPKLAMDILKRPETQPFLASAQFQALNKDAIAASMD